MTKEESKTTTAEKIQKNLEVILGDYHQHAQVPSERMAKHQRDSKGST